jgi:hypothetical protein
VAEQKTGATKILPTLNANYKKYDSNQPSRDKRRLRSNATVERAISCCRARATVAQILSVIFVSFFNSRINSHKMSLRQYAANNQSNLTLLIIFNRFFPILSR